MINSVVRRPHVGTHALAALCQHACVRDVLDFGAITTKNYVVLLAQK